MNKNISIVVGVNLLLALFFAVLGATNSDVAWVGAGILMFFQGGLNFVAGLIMVIIGRREWGLPMLLSGILLAIIGFGVCVGGMGNLNVH